MRTSHFFKALAVDNTNAAVWASVPVLGVLNTGVTSNDADIVSSTTGHLFLAKTAEEFTHDLDGNLTSDGRWTYTWDAENRLIAMETTASAVAAGAPRLRLGAIGVRSLII